MFDSTFSLDLGIPGLTLFASVLDGGVTVFQNVSAVVEESPGLYRFTLTGLPDTGVLVLHEGDITGSYTRRGATELEPFDTETELLDAIAGRFPDLLDIGAVARDVDNSSPAVGSLGADAKIAATGSSLTLLDIRNAIWVDAPSRTLTSGAGSGSLLITITVNDGTDPVAGAQVRIQEVGNAGDTQTAPTDGDGHVIMSLDPGIYFVAIAKLGLNFVTQIVTVADAADQTYSMTVNVGITSPTNPALCTLYGDLFKLDSTPAANVTVQITLICNGVATFGGAIVLTSFLVLTDGSGHFEQDVVRTDAISPSGSTYEVICNIARLDRRFPAAAGTVNVTAP